MRAIIHTLVLLMLLQLTARSQDAEFSQFFANPLYLNPALAGTEDYNRAIVNYRNQWPSIDNGFVTYNAGYDQYFDKVHGGIGTLVNVDNAGDGKLTTTQVSMIYAYILQASHELFFSMALQATYFQRSLNWSKLRFGDQIDIIRGYDIATMETPPESSTVIAPDFSAGIVFGWKSTLHGGIAVNHLTEPDMAFYSYHEDRVPMKITGHFGANISLMRESMAFDPDFFVSPNLLYQQQGKFHQVNVGLYITRKPIVLGAWFRHNFENSDAFIVLAGIDYRSLKIGYSYDMTLSEIRSNTGGAHEISITYQFGYQDKRRTIYPLRAPGF